MRKLIAFVYLAVIVAVLYLGAAYEPTYSTRDAVCERLADGQSFSAQARMVDSSVEYWTVTVAGISSPLPANVNTLGSWECRLNVETELTT